MSTFDDRKKSFEKKFVHDEELQFKISARRNKYLGQWASQILGYDQEKEKEYIQAVIKSDFEEAGDEDVFRKLKADLKDHNISDEERMYPLYEETPFPEGNSFYDGLKNYYREQFNHRLELGLKLGLGKRSWSIVFFNSALKKVDVLIAF